MPDRAQLIDAFLRRAGWRDAARAPIAGDASNRRYLRLSQTSGGRAVLMDAPDERGEDVRPFLAVTGHLRALGLSAPSILAEDRGAGLLLLEDLGDALFARICAASPKAEEDLYAGAVDLLAELHRKPAPSFLPPYDDAVLVREAALLTGWYMPGAGMAPDDGTSAAYDALIVAAAKATGAYGQVTVLRDYHAENLIWLADRDASARIGLLDYQDALAGHAAYDLVSLLEDARRDTSADLREAMIARYLAATGAPPTAFRAAYAVLGAQRNLKIIGIFARLCLRDGKPSYLPMIPRVWDHLMRDLAHPALADLRAFVAANVPPPEAAVLERIAMRCGRAS